jgi:hypothetical protein
LCISSLTYVEIDVFLLAILKKNNYFSSDIFLLLLEDTVTLWVVELASGTYFDAKNILYLYHPVYQK